MPQFFYPTVDLGQIISTIIFLIPLLLLVWKQGQFQQRTESSLKTSELSREQFTPIIIRMEKGQTDMIDAILKISVSLERNANDIIAIRERLARIETVIDFNNKKG